MRTVARVDANQSEIVADLRRLGCLVAHTHTLGQGMPDILVSAYNRRTGKPALVWVEIKSAKGTLTPDEAEFHAQWTGMPVIVARCTEDVLRWFGMVEEPK